MRKITLVRHHPKYIQQMSELTYKTAVQYALGLPDIATGWKGTENFIHTVIEEEQQGKQISRVILNEDHVLIGVITLKDIKGDMAHVGTWLGEPYWGQGYNELAKLALFKEAFTERGFTLIFAGAKLSNIRSRKAQEKLPYMTFDVGDQYPQELAVIEKITGEACVLHAIKKENFLSYLKTQSLQ
ncbi:N-acetyltransferase [Lysinibacillus alkalisoli]|uniref:N-acetyltransferase n=1 Tax=Lysinibacillus alkalisoli TaxID=1911548 RepID=A0A917GAM2_9BACI|nr:GNAT family protein [Lysinibacillus alkalisoli]GGG33621.1 N-acetyltransferase [Lysinibacillus alkalisoli]